MTIWMLAVILFVIVGALGRQVGAIRMSISCAGAVLGLFLAGPLAIHVRSALGAAGFKNPVLAWALGAPLVFLGIMMVFNSIAVAVYLKIGGYYKHRAPDDVRMRWERLDGQLGLCVGLVAAVVYLIAGSAYIYHVGYLTRQIESPGDNPIWLRMANKLRDDLTGTGFDRAAAGVASVSPQFTHTADLLGLLYHNRELQTRLPEYPLFLSLAENGEVQSVLTNETFAVLLPAETNVSLIIKHPSMPILYGNAEVQRVAQELDFPDLIGFLKTGRSEKYAEEPMIGKWQLDVAATARQFAKANAKATVTELNRLRGVLRYRVGDYQLITTPDEKVFLKGSQPPPAAYAQLLAQLFRPTTAPPPVGGTNPPPPTLMTGTWKKEGEKYEITLDQGGTAAVSFVEKGKLAAAVGGNPVVFGRLD